MGLTRFSVGKSITKNRIVRGGITVALAGNPNVGKSTIFNALTGMHQHTGNWPGKTVQRVEGTFEGYTLVDLPGCYSLQGRSPEEAVAAEYLRSDEAAYCIVVCDATALERGLALTLEILQVQKRCVVCVNLMDEAARRGIKVDVDRLQARLGVPVVATSAGKKQGLKALTAAMEKGSFHPVRVDCAPTDLRKVISLSAAQIAKECVTYTHEYKVALADRLLTGKWTALPCMLLLLAFIFWLTMQGVGYPSAWLQRGLFALEDMLYEGCVAWGWPLWLCDALWRGMYRVAAWVVAVMLPPMAIFFPLFTLMEDVGLLPRIAFNMDRGFQKCHACGKQSLCMMMGLGCNAAGVVGCRIIDSRRERLMAMVTNAFMPCNGRFPMLLMLLSMMTVGCGAFGSLWAALGLAILLGVGVGATFLSCRMLSATWLKGESSPLTLELPPYRRPAVGQVLVRSLVDRTLFVLGRAVCVAAPAGLLIWGLANIQIDGQSLLQSLAALLDPVGAWFGMDGMILLAFVLGLPAGEIVLPLILMGYTGGQVLMEAGSLSTVSEILTTHGWTTKTVVCVLLFCLMHWPCSTTLLTIKKESGSWGWTVLAAVLPTVLGLLCCRIIYIL